MAMATATTTGSAARTLFGDRPSRSAFGSSGRRHLDGRGAQDGITLEQRLTGVWRDACATGAARCPLCSATIARGAGMEAAVCTGCGTELS